MYIVLEGIVGSGKTTQVKKLVEYFTSPQPSPQGEGDSTTYPLGRRGDRGVRCIREPGSTPIAEDIRHLAQGKVWESETMHPLTNAYLFAAARAQTLQTVVRPALERGDIVISDRSFLSSLAIQGEAQGVGIERVMGINAEAISGLLPDIVFYLEIDVENALSRTSDHLGDKFEREDRDFYRKIVDGYEKCAKLEIMKDRFVTIDARGSEEEVFARILAHL